MEAYDVPNAHRRWLTAFIPLVRRCVPPFHRPVTVGLMEPSVARRLRR